MSSRPPASPRLLRAASCVAYLLGLAVGALHPLVEVRSPPCTECAEADPGPALVAVCEGAGCPDPDHHHHHAPRPTSHDSTHCNLCQKHYASDGGAPAGAVGACDVALAGAVAPATSLPPPSPFARPSVRAPPAA